MNIIRAQQKQQDRHVIEFGNGSADAKTIE